MNINLFKKSLFQAIFIFNKQFVEPTFREKIFFKNDFKNFLDKRKKIFPKDYSKKSRVYSKAFYFWKMGDSFYFQNTSLRMIFNGSRIDIEKNFKKESLLQIREIFGHQRLYGWWTGFTINYHEIFSFSLNRIENFYKEIFS